MSGCSRIAHGMAGVAAVVIAASAAYADAPNAPKTTTALFEATRTGDLQAMGKALRRGAGVAQRTAAGATALHLAAAAGHVEAAALLLNKGAAVNARIKPRTEDAVASGFTALHLAVAQPPSDQRRRLIALLIKRGADVNAQSADGRTPLHLAAGRGAQDVARRLLAAGADPSVMDASGVTPPFAAMRADHRALAAFLAAHLRRPDLWTAAGIGAGGRLTTLLARAPKRVNQPNPHDRAARMPLHYAAAGGQVLTARLLLEHGAKVNAHGVAGTDHQARRGFTPLHLAAKYGRRTLVQLLIDHGARVDARHATRGTPLYIAARHGHPKVMDLLLAAGADVQALVDRDKHQTLLHDAAARGDIGAIVLLIERGARVDARDARGRTPLHLAVAHGRRAAAKLLLRQGADPAAVDGIGRSSVELARREGREHLASMLRRLSLHSARGRALAHDFVAQPAAIPLTAPRSPRTRQPSPPRPAARVEPAQASPRSTATDSPSPPAESEHSATSASSILQTARFVASRNSDVYHKPDCTWAKKINLDNLIGFPSSQAAREAGYEICSFCKDE